MNYKGKSVIVTGATGALGGALAQEFADQEARVTICGRDRIKTQNQYFRMEDHTRKCDWRQVDITSSDQVAQLV